jgi:HlyD family secretion protein
MKRRLLVVVVVIVAAIGAFFALRPRPVQVDLRVIDRGPLVSVLDEEGRTRLRRRVVIAAPVGGALVEPALVAGDDVEAGAVVALIEPPAPPLVTPAERAGLLAAVRSAQAATRQARAGQQTTEAALEAGQREVERLSQLVAASGATRVQLEEAQARLHTLEHQREAAVFAVAVATHQLTQTEASLARATGGTSGPPFAVTSPIAGRVLAVMTAHGGPVAVGTPLVEIGDPSSLEVVIPVLSDDAATLPAGARAALEGWGAAPGAGRLVRIEPRAFTRLSALGVEEARVNAIFSVDGGAPTGVGDGWRVRARIERWRIDDALRAPIAALVRTGDRQSALVEKDGRAARVDVVAGRRSGPLVEITGGLVAGARVVLRPGDRVRDGTAIVARTTAEPAPE